MGMRGAVYAVRVGEDCIKELEEKLEGKRPLGRPGVDGRKVLKYIL